MVSILLGLGILIPIVVAFVVLFMARGRTTRRESEVAIDDVQVGTSSASIGADEHGNAGDSESIESEEEIRFSGVVPERNDDKRQDLLDYLAAMQSLGSYKSRYSALQNASYVANLIIEEYQSSGKEEGFYDYVISFCEKMKFQSYDEVYGISEEVVKSLRAGETVDEATKKIIHRQSSRVKVRRPDPDQIYPINKTRNNDVDDFVELCKIVIHTRVQHIKTPENDCLDEINRVVQLYKPREGRSCYDFFTNAFQFGYLKEKRFQELYFIVQTIADAKKEGLSNEETIRRINNTYKTRKDKQQVRVPREAINGSSSNDKVKESVPFHTYSDIQHRIISIATRISRRYYYNKLFKKTGDIAIGLINKYHCASGSVMSEKAYYTFTLSGLQKEDKKNDAVYAALIEAIELLFQGISEEEVLIRLSKDKKIPEDLSQILTEQKASTDKQPIAKKKIVRSSCLTGRNSLIRIIVKCEMPLEFTKQCINQVSQLDSRINYRIKLTEKEYFEALQTAMKSRMANDMNSQVLSLILTLKLKDAQNLDILRLIRSRFPNLYKVEKRKKSNKPKSKRFR